MTGVKTRRHKTHIRELLTFQQSSFRVITISAMNASFRLGTRYEHGPRTHVNSKAISFHQFNRLDLHGIAPRDSVDCSEYIDG